MKDDRFPADVERRIASSLHAAAPLPAPDLADRAFRRTAATRQQRRWGGLTLAAAMAAAAAAVMLVVIGLQLGGMLRPDRDIGTEPSAVAATPSPSASAAPASATPTLAPTPSEDGFPGGVVCENEEFGFTVSYPADWWANEAVTPDDPAGTPIPACTYFAEDPVELQPNAGLPPGIAVIVDRAEGPAGGEAPGVEVVERHETEVDGRPAVVEELEWTEDTVFQRAGDRTYSYRISVPDGEALLVSTDTHAADADAAAYAEHRQILDLMMETLDFAGS